MIQYKISPRYQMSLVQSIIDCLSLLYGNSEDIELYIKKWHEEDGAFGDYDNFHMFYLGDGNKLDVKKTLHNIDSETLLKIAIDLGIDTPDYIPCVPMFKNELKASYEMASQTFEKAFKNVESEPSLAVGLANSALESIIKKILSDDKLDIQWKENDTLSSLIKSILKSFQLNIDTSSPKEIKTISSSLIKCCKAIEDLRSAKTEFHGAIDSTYFISEPLYAYFIVNAVTTVGLFLLNFYKTKFQKKEQIESCVDDNGDLPF